MKCPKCNKEGKQLVTETRRTDDALMRRRFCGFCGIYFVTQETAVVGLKMPTQKPRVKKEKAIRNTGADLKDYW
jgi:transcriptional regulator NrdR family protein